MVQLRLEAPTVADWGDRYVLRSYSPQRTIGGGTVLEANPDKARRFDAAVVARLKAVGSGSTAQIVEQHLLKLGAAIRGAEAIARETALNPADAQRILEELGAEGKVRDLEAEGKRCFVHAGAWLMARNSILDAVGRFHRDNPARLGLKRQELKSKLASDFSPALFDRLLRELLDEAVLVQELERFRLPEHRIRLNERDRELADRLLRLYNEAGFESPGVREAALDLGESDLKRVERVLVSLYDQGLLVDVGEGIVLARAGIESAERKIREHFGRNEQMTASEFRQLVGTSRKYAIPLLNYFDSRGLTQRRGEVRVLRRVQAAADRPQTAN
jgi:selenocysteine-specific elongation factor